MPIQCTHRQQQEQQQEQQKQDAMPIQCTCRPKRNQKDNQITNAHKIRKALHHASAAHSDHMKQSISEKQQLLPHLVQCHLYKQTVSNTQPRQNTKPSHYNDNNNELAGQTDLL